MAAGNRAVTGKFVGYSSSWLTARLAKVQAAYDACLDAHQSYARPGFSFNRVQFEALSTELAEIQYAIDVAAGTRPNRTYADFSA